MRVSPNPGREKWDLSLYVSGKDHPTSQNAYANVVRICEEHLPGEYSLTLVDVNQAPEIAIEEQVLAVPTLIRRDPKPARRIIGDLADADRVLISLGVKAISSHQALDTGLS